MKRAVLTIAITSLLCGLCVSLAQPFDSSQIYVCTNKCLVYKHGFPRPVLESVVGQNIRGKVDASRKYLTWQGKQGSFYADIRHFMLKSELDGVYEQALALQDRLSIARQSANEAKLKAVDQAPTTVTGTIKDEYGNVYTYTDRVESEGRAEAKLNADRLASNVTILERELSVLKKKWGDLLRTCGYNIAW